MNKYNLNITRDYCPDWTIGMALRELVANAIDTKQPWLLNLDQEAKTLTIASKGAIPLSALRLGHSVKDSSAIGRFGEGLKVAASVLTRNDIALNIYQPETHWQFEFGQGELGENLQVVTRVSGRTGDSVETVCYFPDLDMLNDAYTELQGLLIDSDDAEEYLLFSCDAFQMFRQKAYSQAALYVNGLLIKHSHELEFSYNFQPEFININRDRTHLDIYEVSKVIVRQLENNFIHLSETFLDILYLSLEKDVDRDFWALTDSSEYPRLHAEIVKRVDKASEGKPLADPTRRQVVGGYVLSSSLSSAYRGGYFGKLNIERFEKKKQPDWHKDLEACIEANKSKLRRDVRQQLEAILKKHEAK